VGQSSVLLEMNSRPCASSLPLVIMHLRPPHQPRPCNPLPLMLRLHRPMSRLRLCTLLRLRRPTAITLITPTTDTTILRCRYLSASDSEATTDMGVITGVEAITAVTIDDHAGAREFGDVLAGGLQGSFSEVFSLASGCKPSCLSFSRKVNRDNPSQRAAFA
jgi:hypothetical protein